MKIEYASEKLCSQCTGLREAKRLFGGDALLANSLLARINALKSAETIKDIIVQKSFRFHALDDKKGKKLKGYFAIDVKTKREPWRIILQPLDESLQPYNPCKIDEIAGGVKIVAVMEVSKHYE